jgi:hypothetical protein
MRPDEVRRRVEEVTRDLDLALYRLERPAPDAEPEAERRRLRRELERCRDRLQSLTLDLG